MLSFCYAGLVLVSTPFIVLVSRHPLYPVLQVVPGNFVSPVNKIKVELASLKYSVAVFFFPYLEPPFVIMIDSAMNCTFDGINSYSMVADCL